LDSDQTVRKVIFGLLKRSFDFPIHVTATVCATSYKHNSDGRVLNIELPDSLHYVLGVRTSNEIIAVSHAKHFCHENPCGAAESIYELISFPLIKVAVRDEDFSSDWLNLRCWRSKQLA
jgi:hypothetical protein